MPKPTRRKDYKAESMGINKVKIGNEFDHHLCRDDQPSFYFNELFKDKILSSTFPFTLLADLKTVEQSPQHHPEGNVWNHTLLVVDCVAARRPLSKNPRVLMWAALLHDLGKASTTRVRGGRITAYDHDKEGAKLAVDFLSELTNAEELIQGVAKMVRWHMQILFVTNQLPFSDLEGMVREVDIDEIALLSLCDRLGRGDLSESQIMKEYENLEYFLRKCRPLQAASLPHQ